jgi:hypothetical protein
VKRTNLDARIAKCAQRTGATLKEGFEVTKGSTLFDKETALWHVTSSEVPLPPRPPFSLIFAHDAFIDNEAFGWVNSGQVRII